MMNSVPDGAGSTRLPAGVPEEYVEFLQLADGAIFGRIVIFDSSVVSRMQVYAERKPDVPIQLGELDWFCFGKVNEDPLLIRRSDGTVWGFPDIGVLWWQSDHFVQLSDTLHAFLNGYVFSYGEFSGADGSDYWLQLLRLIGRAVGDYPTT